MPSSARRSARGAASRKSELPPSMTVSPGASSVGEPAASSAPKSSVVDGRARGHHQPDRRAAAAARRPARAASRRASRPSRGHATARRRAWRFQPDDLPAAVDEVEREPGAHLAEPAHAHLTARCVFADKRLVGARDDVGGAGRVVLERHGAGLPRVAIGSMKRQPASTSRVETKSVWSPRERVVHELGVLLDVLRLLGLLVEEEREAALLDLVLEAGLLGEEARSRSGRWAPG